MTPSARFVADVRTTVTSDDELLRRAKRLAVESGRGLADVIDEAMRMLLARRGAPRTAGSQIDLPVFGGSGMLPRVDLEQKDALSVVSATRTALRLLADVDVP